MLYSARMASSPRVLIRQEKQDKERGSALMSYQRYLWRISLNTDMGWQQDTWLQIFIDCRYTDCEAWEVFRRLSVCIQDEAYSYYKCSQEYAGLTTPHSEIAILICHRPSQQSVRIDVECSLQFYQRSLTYQLPLASLNLRLSSGYCLLHEGLM